MVSDDYLYDVFVSYPRRGAVEPWVRKHLVPRLEKALQENLGRDKVFIDQEMIDTGVSWPDALEYALRRSRVLLAVLSRQYFKKSWCLAELDSMIERQQALGFGTSSNPELLVHAIVAHDCEQDEHIPPQYRNIQRKVFKPFVYDFADTDWGFYREFQDAINVLADRLAVTVENAPRWDESFPVVRPVASEPDRPTVPTF